MALLEHNLGLVVQSIVSLTKSLVTDSLSFIVLIKLNTINCFAKKMLEAFAVQKLLTIFWQKNVKLFHTIRLKF